MSGAGVQIKISGLKAFQTRLDQLLAVDRRELLEGIGALLESSTQDRIASGQGEAPDGSAWPAWSERYAARRRAGASLLYDSSDLERSITFVAGADLLQVGTNLEYGATHQFGDADRNIPARPYLGLSEEDEANIRELVADFLAGQR